MNSEHSSSTASSSSLSSSSDGAVGEDANMQLLSGSREHETSHVSSRNIGQFKLAALIFFTVSGGPFGIEQNVATFGPLPSILGMVVYPMLVSYPTAMVVSEQTSKNAKDGGFVHWTSTAFGRRAGFVNAVLSFLSGCADTTLYPKLFMNTLEQTGNFSSLSITMIGVVFGVSLYALILSGVRLTGAVSVLFAIITASSLLLTSAVAIPHFNSTTLLQQPTQTTSTSIGLYISTLYWNYSGIDTTSLIASKVKNPRQLYPRAMKWAIILAITLNSVPILFLSGADKDWPSWQAGSFVKAAKVVGGNSLSTIFLVGALLSCVSMFIAEILEDSYLLYGSAKIYGPSFLTIQNERSPWVRNTFDILTDVIYTFYTFDFDF